MKRKETKRELQLAAEVELLKSSCMNLDQAFQRALDDRHKLLICLQHQEQHVLVMENVACAQEQNLHAAGRMIAERDLAIAALRKQIELQQLTLKGLEQYTWGKNTRVEQTITVPA